MNVLKYVPMILGGAGIIQVGLNKTIAETCGLSTASLINGLVVAFCAAAVFGVVYCFPGWFPDVVAFPRGKEMSFRWWYLLPGVIGFCFVFLVPLMVMEVGALPVFLGIIAGQIVMGMVWDAYVENIPVNAVRVAGAFLTLAGALLVVWKR